MDTVVVEPYQLFFSLAFASYAHQLDKLKVFIIVYDLPASSILQAL